MIEQFPGNLPNRKATENSSSKSGGYELSENGIPLVLNKEGQKIESGLYKQLSELAPEKAIEIYKALKSLEGGEFRNSKLKDENGELRIVWHGSPRKFDEFKADAKGEWCWRNHGVHFSSSKEVVEEYSEKAYSALNNIRYYLAEEVAGIKDGRKLSGEDFANGDKVYNEIIADLMEKGEESHFYKKGYKFNPREKKVSDERDPSLDAIQYGKQNFGTDWAFEIFNGEMPNKENSYFDEHNKLWLGNSIGKYAYACVLNTENPFEDETTDVDNGFENGENAHAEKMTDGTILYHPEPVSAMGGPKEETRDTYSVAVFDPKQIRIIGVESSERKGQKIFYANKARV